MSKARDALLDAIEQAEDRRQSTTRDIEYGEDGLRLVTPSIFDGCDRATVFKIAGYPATNTSDRLPAWMGTTIHDAAEEALTALDPFGDEHLLEHRLPGDPEHGLGSGRFDWLWIDEKNLIDLKTVKKRDKRYFPSDGKIEQVMVYGRQAIKAGLDIETVEILGLCRDGNRLDIMSWGPKPYDPERAEFALRRLDRLRARAAAVAQGELDALPRPDRPARSFCSIYCEFYDPDGLCAGVVR